MNIIDLSHFISSDMHVYPDTRSPEITDANSIEKNGFAEKIISMSTHTGTHVDAPAHMIKNLNTLDKYDINQFIGEGKLINISKGNKKFIDIEDIKDVLEEMYKAEFLLFYTGWYEYWGRAEYYRDYPVLSEKLVNILTSYNLKGIGIDTISVDPVGSTDFRNHMTIFRRNMVIIENLKNLKALTGKRFTFFCLPLKIENADGSPVRAYAIVNYQFHQIPV